MKTKHIYFFFLLFMSTSFPQVFDSTSTDTITFDDSTTIIFNDTTVADTAALFSTPRDSAMADTLVPLYQQPFSPFSYFISHDDILRTDYEYTGDILELYPFRFFDETAFYGQPTYYGELTYPENTGYLKDKILLDNRRLGQLDLNIIQSELIDSVEIINLPRSFLYSGPVNVTVVNFIEKDFISLAPYTRIKYYEGPFGKAFFDGIFNTLVFNRLNFFLDVTNRTADESYENTEYGSWQVTTKLKYIASNKLNIVGSYNFANLEAGINRGINVDSISKVTDDIEKFLYDEIRAPVVSTTGNYEALQHNFKLQALWKPGEKWTTDLKVYSLFDQATESFVYDDSSVYKIKNSSLGIAFDQSYSLDILNLKLVGSYENSDSEDEVNFGGDGTESQSLFSIAPIASIYFLDSMVIPSVFYKYTYFDEYYDYSSESTSGLGFDINFIYENFRVYLGYSEFDNIYNNKATGNLELGVTYKSDNIFGNIRYFSVSRNFYPGDDLIDYAVGFSGLGLILKLNWWKILFENYSQYYFDENYVWQEYYRLKTGLYYKDILFNDNLDLKAGFEFNWSKAAERAAYPFENFYSISAKNDYRLDFTLSGVIAKRAIVYFTWENLTNNNYFIVPYYPMPERNIRFGVAWELFN